MAGKSKKVKGAGGAAGGGAAEKSKGGGKSRRTGRKVKSSRFAVDVFTAVAMENAYATCHNVQDLLIRRGFPWANAQKKKKKGKK